MFFLYVLVFVAIGQGHSTPAYSLSFPRWSLLSVSPYVRYLPVNFMHVNRWCLPRLDSTMSSLYCALRTCWPNMGNVSRKRVEAERRRMMSTDSLASLGPRSKVSEICFPLFLRNLRSVVKIPPRMHLGLSRDM